jgi:hypothetical protein
MTNELRKILDDAVDMGANPLFVKELKGVVNYAEAAAKEEAARKAALPELTDERKAAIAARRAKYADRRRKSTWKY